MAAAVTAACGEGTRPADTAALIAVSGNDQRTLPGGQVPRPLTVRAVDAQGRPRAGVIVRWTGSQGSRFSPGIDTTDANGEASGVWLLGSATGSYSATATDDSATVNFTATSASDALVATATPNPLNFDAIGDTASVFIRVRTADGSLDTLLKPHGWGSPFPIVAEPIHVPNAKGMVLRSNENGSMGQGIRFGDIVVGLTVNVQQVAAGARIIPLEGEAARDTVLAARDSQVTLRVLAVDKKGYQMEDATALAGVTWQSSNESVATVSNGIVQTNADGTAVITATFASGSAQATLRVWTFRPTDIAVGGGTACAVPVGYGLSCWGFRNLGNNSWLDEALTPEPRTAPSFVTISLADAFGCGLDASALTWCWGRNVSGALGNSGHGAYTATPVPVTSAPAFTAIAVGGSHGCGLTAGGKVYCWGSTYNGRVGDGTYGEKQCGEEYCRPVPTEVKAQGQLFTAVTAGGGHSCALTADGRAFCWGANLSGQLGSPRQACAGYVGGDSLSGTSWCRTVPTEVATNLRFSSLSAGISYTCGITTEKKLYCWGSNLFSVFGVPDLPMGTGDVYTTPVAVAPAMEFSKVFAGRQHTCAIDAAGAAWCWGVGGFGQLGIGSIPTSTCANGACAREPRLVAGNLLFKRLSLGAAYTCGVTTDDVAYCWGAGEQGALGTGGRENRVSPARVALQRP
jgi:alpha-tubulin suppressor-like RCC1 family protein